MLAAEEVAPRIMSSARARVIQDYEDCLDPDGLMQNRRFPHRGASKNGLRYSAQGIISLYTRGLCSDEERRRFAQVVRSCYVPAYPGLLTRGPGITDQQGPDDYVLIATACLVLGLDGIADALLCHGEARWFWPLPLNGVWNNVQVESTRHPDGRKNWSAWLGRQPAFMAHLAICARRLFPPWRYALAAVLVPFAARWWLTLGWWAAAAVPACLVGLVLLGYGLRRLGWLWSVHRAGRSNPKDQDGWVLSWGLCVAASVAGPDWAQRKVIAAWWTRFRRAYPGGMCELMAEYFPDGQREHFLSRWHVD